MHPGNISAVGTLALLTVEITVRSYSNCHITDVRTQAFFSRVIGSWNSLPEQVVSTSSLVSFKRRPAGSTPYWGRGLTHTLLMQCLVTLLSNTSKSLTQPLNIRKIGDPNCHPKSQGNVQEKFFCTKHGNYLLP